ncbi:thiol reductant ABC exporter subunit CydD [Paenibacillus sp. YPG26]|uniref:thiol reductant ABC exporter subunit CydD n=1 Tax=Paenibacillus sp. YPG26 TaxID=2878915 RepID=UPI00203B4CB3|nr:thiol reductant ABC exporter subunit CydD [Paenibacillus sp. YPG26]USB32996.1 thiol reductant ABC exporter subunit CydD [Paenibacillus sp. YPG26]
MGRELLGLRGIRPVMAAMAGLTLIQTLSIILQAKWLAETVTALFAGEPLRKQYGTAALFLCAFAVRQITVYFQQSIAAQFAELTGARMRNQLMVKLFELGPRYAGREGTGNLVTLVLEGITKFRNYVELLLPRMLAGGFTPMLILGYIYSLDVASGTILTVTMPILIVFMILVGLAARRQAEGQLQTYRALSNHFVDSLRGLETLRFLGRSRTHSQSIERVSGSYRLATMKTLRTAFLSSFALDFFTMLSVASVAVSLGLRLVSGNMVLLPALTVLILAPEYFLPVRMVGADFHATLDGKEAGQAMQAIINSQSSEELNGEAVLEPDYSWTPQSRLTLTGLTVTHEEGGRASLEEVTLELEAGMKIGIIGESGAGKSTLIDILGGFLRPTAGRVQVDGRMMSSLSEAVWRNQIVYIPQQPYLFSSTLEDNIKFYSPQASLEDVKQAIEAAGLGPVVGQLTGGYKEMIGGGGRRLSGGQEQRVALARAFLSDRPIILLDEPTAHLDIETEYELKATMLGLFEGKTAILATHRLHWLPDMDVIVVIDQGRVAEVGSHEDLMSKQGAYYALIKEQEESAE